MGEYQNILTLIDKDISSFVSDKFNDFISQKVKKEVEQKKEQFVKDLNMCQEEYPVFEEKDRIKNYIEIINDDTLLVQSHHTKYITHTISKQTGLA